MIAEPCFMGLSPHCENNSDSQQSNGLVQDDPNHQIVDDMNPQSENTNRKFGASFISTCRRALPQASGSGQSKDPGKGCRPDAIEETLPTPVEPEHRGSLAPVLMVVTFSLLALGFICTIIGALLLGLMGLPPTMAVLAGQTVFVAAAIAGGITFVYCMRPD